VALTEILVSHYIIIPMSLSPVLLKSVCLWIGQCLVTICITLTPQNLEKEIQNEHINKYISLSFLYAPERKPAGA
jgi:hypothetical protein